jgi:hypothetical protein
MYKELAKAILSKYFGVRFYRIVRKDRSVLFNEPRQPPPDLTEREPPVTYIRRNPVVDIPPSTTDFDPLAIDPLPQPKKKGKKK